MNAPSRRIVLVDDDRIVLEGLRQLFDFEDNLEVCGKATSAEEAQEVVRREAPEAVVVDLILGEGPDGIQLTKSLKSMDARMPVLMLSGHDESLFAERALAAGASGYLMKDEAVDVLFDAIRTVLRGGIWLSETVWQQLGGEARRAPDPDVAGITAEERMVLGEIRIGNRTSYGIAEALGRRDGEVTSVLEALHRRLGLGSLVELALYAQRHDISSSTQGVPPHHT